MRLILACLLASALVVAQDRPIVDLPRATTLPPEGLDNLDFHDGKPGEVPSVWRFTTEAPGYKAEVRNQGCKVNPQCVVVTVSDKLKLPFANLMQTAPADSYRGKRIKIGMWIRTVKTTEGDVKSRGWLRVDLKSRAGVSFDRDSDILRNPPVTPGDWTYRELKTKVSNEAQFINLGLMLLSKGEAWLDGITLEVK